MFNTNMKTPLAKQHFAELVRQGRRGGSYYALYENQAPKIAPRLMWKAIGELLKSEPTSTANYNPSYLEHIERDYLAFLDELKRGNIYIYELLKFALKHPLKPLLVTTLQPPCSGSKRFLVSKDVPTFTVNAESVSATRIREFMETYASDNDLCTLYYDAHNRVFVFDLLVCLDELPGYYTPKLVYDQANKSTLAIKDNEWTVLTKGYRNYLSLKAKRAAASKVIIALPKQLA